MRDDEHAVIVAVTVRARQRYVGLARLINEAAYDVVEVGFIPCDDMKKEADIGLFH